ncbi:hypothetical protein CRG98_003616 [Punica granatum]|uniref:Integrase catalytic domain-containing protein n=1 Tax=Punica granatum TaxID=22663 RepID=A0A2I0L5J1_PUNGR|nr:hypothetical protein CRG98_003616 [Punica granatum]
MNVDLNRIRPSKTAIRAFDGSRREVNGEIDLLIDIDPCSFSITFQVLDILNAFSLLLGRPWIHSAGAIPSSLHQKVKFIVEEKIILVKGEEDYAIYKETAVPYISVGDDENLPFHSFETISVIWDYGGVGPSRADRMIGKLHSNPNLRRVDSNPSEECLGEPRPIYFGEGLDQDSLVPEIEESLHRLEDRQLTSLELTEEINVGTKEEPRVLKIEVFAWSYADMPGLDPSIVKHFLPLDTEKFPPKRQQLRRQRAGLLLRIKEKVVKQINAGFLEVCNYSEWVANIVPVEKKDGRVRVCVDYRDLNKASPKDNFPLPHIDVLVDNTARHAQFSFMDGFSGYNQIRMAEEDKIKTTFTTMLGTFCYRVMPFGLKNARATYQRAMVTLFHDMMHKEVEIYVDDMIAKSKEGEDHLVNLKRLFDRLKEYKLRLNPAKCTFGARSGKLLGFVVRERGIKVDPDKVKVIKELPPLSSVRETLRRLAIHYFLSGEILYHRSFDSTLLRCIDEHESRRLMEEVHGGNCGPHMNDNAKNLNNKVIDELCVQFKIRHRNSTPYRPQMNGAVEAANKNIKKIIEKMTVKYKDWHEMLPYALLAYRTSIRTSTGATPYSLVYGMEAVLPIEVEIPSMRILAEAELEEVEWAKQRLRVHGLRVHFTASLGLRPSDFTAFRTSRPFYCFPRASA